jgi:arylsulfatase A-like enzyme
MFSSAADAKEPRMPRPNVLILMSDHTNAQALAPGSQCLTPNIDALAGAAVRFGRCYTTNAICSPARASLMTGTYPSTHGMWDCTHTQRREWVNVAERLRYFSQPLADAGYAMGYFGKWHVEQTCDLGRFGWHEHDHLSVSARPEAIPGTEVLVPKAGYRDYLMAAAGRDEGCRTHPAFDLGIDFIRRRSASRSGHPWCCFVSAAEPHDPYIPPKRFLDMYDIDAVRVSPTLRDELGGKPEVLRRMQAVWAGLTENDWKFISAAYWATISFLDAEAGRILDALRESGEFDNTIVIVTADHGDMLGGHGLHAKGVGTAYEEVYNIPLVVRVPGLTAGREEADAVVSLVDVAPTLLDLCECEPLPDAHGRSLRPLLDGTADAADWQDAYAEFFGQRFVYTQRLVWHGRWKYVFSPGGVDELYDLESDPHEVRNLAGDADRREVLIEMCKRMWRKMKAIGDESLFKTHYATLRTAPVGPLSIEAD